MALSDPAAPPIRESGPLCREILRTCINHAFEGVCADFGPQSTPDRAAFLTELGPLSAAQQQKAVRFRRLWPHRALGPCAGQHRPVRRHPGHAAGRRLPHLRQGARSPGHRAAADGFSAALPHRRGRAFVPGGAGGPFERALPQRVLLPANCAPNISPISRTARPTSCFSTTRTPFAAS